MPSSTIHLLIAHKIAASGAVQESGRLLLGSIAPDAAQIRSGAAGEELEQSHLKDTDWHSAWNNALELLRAYPNDPYILGAAAHILTDVLWLAGPYREYLRKQPEERDPKEIQTEYASDMEKVERYLFRQTGTDRLWSGALVAPVQDLPGLVTAREVDLWRKFAYSKLQESKAPADMAGMKLSEILAFIDETAKRILRLMDGDKKEI